MSAFEFVFSLFGLLLGFSVVELVGGLARTLEARLRLEQAYRVGWLTPLLAVFVMMDLMTFWLSAWRLRDSLTVTGGTLTAGLAFAGSYYLAAHLVFPPREADAPDLDLHYLRVKRWVLGILFALFAVQVSYFLSVPALAVMVSNAPAAASVILFGLMLVIAAFARGRRANLVLLSLLILRYLVALF
ncbi:hypothetical protein [Sphingomonas sp. CFBP 13720]|uniref:hypothetical protein n=1 Tax=Sphingomonas sp. CFBP 13720 TaxID=2775302 RepID=UPI00177ECA73|nr:hypothetical protein [Sphingomonas sp. CFBP 13720]MBD8679665.1 hypothetical protein [Sphingomonas sp. CFBP 13720]